MKLTDWVLKKTDTLHKDNLEFVRKFDSNVTLSPHKIKRRHLKFLQVLILKIIDLFQRIIFKDNTFSKLLLVDKESKFLIKYHCKIQKLRDSEVTSPFVLTGENVNKIGTKHLFKSIKSKSRSVFINKLNISI